MNQDEFSLITKGFKSKESGGFSTLAEGSQLTVHVAHAGAALSVSKVDGYRLESSLLILRTVKKETFHVRLDDVFAIAAEGAAGGGPARKPVGFGL